MFVLHSSQLCGRNKGIKLKNERDGTKRYQKNVHAVTHCKTTLLHSSRLLHRVVCHRLGHKPQLCFTVCKPGIGSHLLHTAQQTATGTFHQKEKRESTSHHCPLGKRVRFQQHLLITQSIPEGIWHTPRRILPQHEKMSRHTVTFLCRVEPLQP